MVMEFVGLSCHIVMMGMSKMVMDAAINVQLRMAGDVSTAVNIQQMNALKSQLSQ